MNKKHSIPQKQASKQQGFTLIEVLVSMVILSIGLLGLAGLQTTGLRNNQSAYFASQAAIYANDMFERMRANRTAALADNYNIDANTDSNPAGVTGAQIDIDQWRNLIITNLPNGASSVNNNSGRVTVVVSWNDAHANGGTRNITVESEL